MCACAWGAVCHLPPSPPAVIYPALMPSSIWASLVSQRLLQDMSMAQSAIHDFYNSISGINDDVVVVVVKI